MPDNALFVERNKIIGAAPPQNYTGTAMTAFYVSMKHYGRMTIVIQTGAWAAGTAAVSLLQATSVAAAGAKALNLDWMWTGTTASGLLTQTAVVADTFNLAVANSLYVIEIDASDLDASNDFDCVTLVVATPGANADFYNVTYILHEPRFAQATPPSAIVN